MNIFHLLLVNMSICFTVPTETDQQVIEATESQTTATFAEKPADLVVIDLTDTVPATAVETSTETPEKPANGSQTINQQWTDGRFRVRNNQLSAETQELKHVIINAPLSS